MRILDRKKKKDKKADIMSLGIVESPSNNRVPLLQRMVSLLREKSLVNKVFVSPCDNVKQSFYKRDLDGDTLLSQRCGKHHNTTDLERRFHFFRSCLNDLFFALQLVFEE